MPWNAAAESASGTHTRVAMGHRTHVVDRADRILEQLRPGRNPSELG